MSGRSEPLRGHNASVSPTQGWDPQHHLTILRALDVASFNYARAGAARTPDPIVEDEPLIA